MFDKVAKLWFNIPEKIRFLIVGGWNTLFSLFVFTMAFFILKNYNLALVCSHFLSVFNSFVCFKKFVFQSRGSFWREFFKINIVYALYLILNFLFLNGIIKIFKVNPVAAQIIVVAILTVYAYLMNKYFAFGNGKKSQKHT